MKQQSNRHVQGHLQLSKLAVWGALHGEQSLTGVVCWYSRRILFGMF